MAFRRNTVLMVAAAAAVLPLAACGSSQPAAKIGAGGSSAPTSASTSTSTSAATPTTSASSSAPTASASSSAPAGGLPDLTLPADVILQFNLPKTGDSAKDAALQGLVLVEQAKYKATELGVSSGPIVDDFDILDARESIKSYLIAKQSKSETVTGTNIYYDWQFPVVDPGEKSMQITFCQDENKFFAKSRTTGQALPQTSGPAQLDSFKADMIIDHDGRWKAALYTWKAGDAACQAAEGH